jgi:hypothetical protein
VRGLDDHRLQALGAGARRRLLGPGNALIVAELDARAFAAARASVVRPLMASRSNSATAAKMWTVNLVAVGLSTAMKSTLRSISAENGCGVAREAIQLGK